MFQRDVTEKIKYTYFMFIDFSKNRVVYDIVREKHVRAIEATYTKYKGHAHCMLYPGIRIRLFLANDQLKAQILVL